MPRSWIAVYWATRNWDEVKGTPNDYSAWLLGGVKRSRSSRMGSKEDAQNMLETAKEINNTAGRPCEGRVEETDVDPEIFRHCEGHPAQSVGARCFGCKKVLTKKDAREAGDRAAND